MAELKPCPICGEMPKVIFKKGYGWLIVCYGDHETNWYQSEDSAIETWDEEIKGETDGTYIKRGSYKSIRGSHLRCL